MSDTNTRHSTAIVIFIFCLRFIYHYWYHTGEILAIRQLLGHPDLPEFVGDLDTQAPYLPH